MERLLGKLAQHRVDRFEDPLGRPLANGGEASSRGRPVAERVVLAADVESSIAGFHRQIDTHIRGTLPSPAPGHEGGDPQTPGGPAPDRAEGSRARPPEVDPAARLHRLPPAGHEVMQVLVPGLRDLVRDVSATLRRAAGAETVCVTPDDLLAIPRVERFVSEHVRSLIAKGWAESDAFADGNHLGSHVFSMLNHAIHGKKTFWVDESLAWMLAETELDIIGRCLRLPFSACAFVFTDRGTLEIAESLLSQEEDCSVRNRELRIMSVYVTCERAVAEDEPQVLNVTFLFDAQGDKWPYLVSRELFVRPDEHLDGILDSHHPSVISEERNPIFLAPELKKLVHLVINAILYATSAHLEPILLSSKIRRLEQSLTGGAAQARAPAATALLPPRRVLERGCLPPARAHRHLQDQTAARVAGDRERPDADEAVHGPRALEAAEPGLGGPAAALDRAVLEGPGARRGDRARIPDEAVALHCGPRISSSSSASLMLPARSLPSRIPAASSRLRWWSARIRSSTVSRATSR